MIRLAAFAGALAFAALAAGACGDDAASGSPSPEGASTTAVPSASPAPFATVTRFPPPVLPTPTASPDPGSLIPEGFLSTEEISKKPLNQEGVSWVRNDGADLPPMLAPCGDPLPANTGDTIAGRQLVLVNATHLWKSERLVVYRDAAAAARAMAALRDALVRCARHDEGGGRHTEWQMEPVDIGDEAFYVGGQLYAGEAPLSYHYRGVVTRVGRAVHILLDHGSSTIAPTLEEVQPMDLSRAAAAALASAEWAR